MLTGSFSAFKTTTEQEMRKLLDQSEQLDGKLQQKVREIMDELKGVKELVIAKTNSVRADANSRMDVQDEEFEQLQDLAKWILESMERQAESGMHDTEQLAKLMQAKAQARTGAVAKRQTGGEVDTDDGGHRVAWQGAAREPGDHGHHGSWRSWGAEWHGAARGPGDGEAGARGGHGYTQRGTRRPRGGGDARGVR